MPPHLIRAVLLDLDDTLIDSAPAFQHGSEMALKLINERYSSLEIERLAREWWATLSDLVADIQPDGSMQKIREIRFLKLLKRLGIDDPTLAEEADRCLGEAQLSALKVFEDSDILDELTETFKLGVITNGAADDHWDSQTTKARHTGLFDRFECFFVSDTERARKPQPAMFLSAADRLGLAPNECVYVGDSPANDVVGAQAAGMPVIWLNRSGRTYAFETAPWHTVASLRELPAILSPGKLPVS